MNHLRIGIPSKGRLADQVSDLLRQAGLHFRRQERSLFARVRDMPVDVIFLRTDDIPVLCAEGAVDLGITGSDLIEESGVELVERLPLAMGRCRLAICVPEAAACKSPSDLDGCRIASSFPRTTKRYLERHGVRAHLVPLSGSVEVMISLGVSEAIVDLVETGSTLAANQLRILDEVGKYETVVVQNPDCKEAELADRIIRRIEGVVIARGYSLLEYNIRRSQLAAAEEITPGYNSPTVNRLEDPDWCAVQVMVKRADVIEVMERLETLGASAVLETQINNCRL